ncbi:MAG: pyruvate kinase [Candidatus Omnitrophica bacterium]|nr:pyruvate kinase [Candidatus Omnitrophota bacterium]
MPKTKIIATLGPATDNEIVFKKMATSGLSVARLNFSHGSWSEHLRRLKMVRLINKKYGRKISVMQDLEGYRIRVGRLTSPVALKKKDIIYITKEDIPGSGREISFDYKGSLKGINQGNFIYIDDGKISLRVKAVEKQRLKTEVVSEGILKEKKGINIPDAKLEFEALTEKDKKDIQFTIKHNIEYVAQSFVNRAKDITLLRSILRKHKSEAKIFAKVESKDALINIDEIIAAADGIIVARGDLGVCLPIYKVPVIQKEVIKKCKIADKPVVVATQMLESMIEEEIPTRAEVSDVANAILDGADCLLVSSETTIGKYPDKVIEMMSKIIKYTESYKEEQKDFLCQ